MKILKLLIRATKSRNVFVRTVPAFCLFFSIYFSMSNFFILKNMSVFSIIPLNSSAPGPYAKTGTITAVWSSVGKAAFTTPFSMFAQLLYQNRAYLQQHKQCLMRVLPNRFANLQPLKRIPFYYCREYQ